VLPITQIDAWEALDSRGDPTVAVHVMCAHGRGQAIAPAGASAGRHEALFIRDGEGPFRGRSVRRHLSKVLPIIREAVTGTDLENPEALDICLRSVDGTGNWANIGGHLGTAVSVAAWLCLADARGCEPWEVIADWTGATATLPLPMFNIISGGAHAGRAIDIQDILIIPLEATSAARAIEDAAETRAATRAVLDAMRYETALVADEGGLAAPFASSAAAIEAVHTGAQTLRPDQRCGIALDVAASEFETEPGVYQLDGDTLRSADLAATIGDWQNRFGIVSIEDPLGEDDDWTAIRPLAGVCQIVGDDRYVTDAQRIEQGIQTADANAVLIKPNQTGSLFGALQAIATAQRAGWATVVSARSGETEERWLVDLAVGSGAGQLKVGSTTRSERTAKWNRLLELEHCTGLAYVGADALGRSAL